MPMIPSNFEIEAPVSKFRLFQQCQCDHIEIRDLDNVDQDMIAALAYLIATLPPTTLLKLEISVATP